MPPEILGESPAAKHGVHLQLIDSNRVVHRRQHNANPLLRPRQCQLFRGERGQHFPIVPHHELEPPFHERRPFEPHVPPCWDRPPHSHRRLNRGLLDLHHPVSSGLLLCEGRVNKQHTHDQQHP